MCDVEQMIEEGSEDKTHILQEKVKELEAYYLSDKWKQDFEYDEAGRLPKDMKRECCPRMVFIICFKDIMNL